MKLLCTLFVQRSALSTFHYRTKTTSNQAGLTSSEASIVLKSSKISIVSIDIYLHMTSRELETEPDIHNYESNSNNPDNLTFH